MADCAFSITSLFAILPGLAGAAIAYSVHKLARVQREEAWLRSLWEYQRSFWQDERMELARSWIACDAAYEEIRPVLKKRKRLAEDGSGNGISAEEYKSLETLDRFAALLTGYRKISPSDQERHGDVLYRIFDDYWIRQISEERREELLWYFRRFYPELWPKN